MKVVIKFENGHIVGIKAKPDGTIRLPVVGERYFSVGMFTSVVQRAEKLSNGWLVSTMNSVYEFRDMNDEEFQQLVDKSGLKITGNLNSGHDGHPSTFYGEIAGTVQKPYVMPTNKPKMLN